MYLSNSTNTTHTQSLCLRRPSHPSSSLLQDVTTIPVQTSIRKSHRNTRLRVMPPLQIHAHSRACAFPSCRRLASLQSRCGNESTRGRGEGWRVADFCRSSPGSNQQCKELTLCWRRLHKLLSNCFSATTAETSDMHHTQALTLPKVQLASPQPGSSPLRPLDTLEAFTAQHTNKGTSPQETKQIHLLRLRYRRALLKITLIVEYSGPRETNSSAASSCLGVLSPRHTHTPKHSAVIYGHRRRLHETYEFGWKHANSS